MLKVCFLIIGGGAGTILRYYLSTWMLGWLGPGFPYGTLAVNVLGCFMIGAIAGLPEGANSLTPMTRLLLMTGFLGGLTTFSSYEYESFLLLRDGAVLKAILNLGGSLIVGFLMVLLGYLCLRLVTAGLKGVSF